MKKKNHRKTLMNILLILLFAGLLASFCGCAHTMQEEDTGNSKISPAQAEPDRTGGQVANPLADLKVSFKLDPRLTRSLYMGDRWISPPTYNSTVHEGRKITIEARAHGVDSYGRPVAVNLRWIPSDPDMVSVSPSQGSQVSITIYGGGQSSLKVVSQGWEGKELFIKATEKDDTIQAKIWQ